MESRCFIIWTALHQLYAKRVKTDETEIFDHWICWQLLTSGGFGCVRGICPRFCCVCGVVAHPLSLPASPSIRIAFFIFPLSSPRKYCRFCVVFAPLPPKKTHCKMDRPFNFSFDFFVRLCRVCGPAPSLIRTNIKSLLPPKKTKWNLSLCRACLPSTSPKKQMLPCVFVDHPLHPSRALLFYNMFVSCLPPAPSPKHIHTHEH